MLIKFINFIESSEVIIDYIYLGEQKDYNVEAQWERVSSGESGFKFGPTMEDESFQIYSLLKYLADEENKISIRCFYNIYRHKKWQDNIKEFNDRVVLVLINNINDYLARIGIDMRLNENNVCNISGGQVNIANDEGTIYATQNNGFDSNELNRMVNNILDNIKDLECEDKEVVEETV